LQHPIIEVRVWGVDDFSSSTVEEVRGVGRRGGRGVTSAAGGRWTESEGWSYEGWRRGRGEEEEGKVEANDGPVEVIT
jgi:hypothetical protein